MMLAVKKQTSPNYALDLTHRCKPFSIKLDSWGQFNYDCEGIPNKSRERNIFLMFARSFLLLFIFLRYSLPYSYKNTLGL